MASRYRSFTKPTLNFLKSTVSKPSLRPTTSPIPTLRQSSSSLPRSVAQLGRLQSLLPLHSAVSAARLISGLGIDSMSSRSLSQGMVCSADPGV